MKKYTPTERLKIVQEVAALPTVFLQMTRLSFLGVSWGSFVRWRKLLREKGEAGLRDRQGKPAVQDRLDALEARVDALERGRV